MSIDYEKWTNRIYLGDALSVLKKLPSNLVNCIVTSPPYYRLRDYQVEGQIGLEDTPQEYIEKLVAVFREARRVLRDDGALWLNIGDMYIDNSLQLIPFKLAVRLMEEGWKLRNNIVWKKVSPMPVSVRNRVSCTWEPLFFFTKTSKYYFDLEAIRVPAKTRGLKKNPGDVWELPTGFFKGAHFAVFSEELVKRPILATCPQWICRKCDKPRERIVEVIKLGRRDDSSRKKWPRGKTSSVMRECPEKGWESIHRTIGWTDCGHNAGWRKGIVLDPFCGSGTTLYVAQQLGRAWIGIDIKPEYVEMSKHRISKIYADDLSRWI